MVTRDCLSNLEAHRVDIPADKYEGCYSATRDTKLAQYTFNRIKEFSIASESVMELDYLIDYYQSGLSLQVEAILRGYGYLKTFPIDSALIIYDKLESE